MTALLYLLCSKDKKFCLKTGRLISQDLNRYDVLGILLVKTDYKQFPFWMDSKHITQIDKQIMFLWENKYFVAWNRLN